MGCDCVPYKLYCVGEVVYGAGPIEGAGMANSVAIVKVEQLLRCRCSSRKLDAKVIRAVGEKWEVDRDNVQALGACSSRKAGGSSRSDDDVKDKSNPQEHRGLPQCSKQHLGPPRTDVGGRDVLLGSVVALISVESEADSQGEVSL